MNKLCVMHKTPDGWQECEVVNYPIYNYRSLLPLMEIKNKSLNAIGRALVPMAGIFYTSPVKGAAGRAEMRS